MSLLFLTAQERKLRLLSKPFRTLHSLYLTTPAFSVYRYISPKHAGTLQTLWNALEPCLQLILQVQIKHYLFQEAFPISHL